MAHERDEMLGFCRVQYPRLVGAVAMYTGDAQLAEDLAQDALTSAIRDWDKIQRSTSPGAYVHRIAMNLANDHFRRQRVARRARARLGRVDDVHHDADTPDAIAVRRAVGGLPPRQRQVVVLRYQGDLTLAEIADALNVTVGTVKSQLHHALAALRERLQSEEAADAH